MAYTVRRYLRLSGPPVSPNCYVYILGVQPPRGDIFRIEIRGINTVGSLMRLPLGGAAWLPVAGQLSVEVGSEYAAFWLNVPAAANLPTAVLRHALGQTDYRFRPGHADAAQQQIRIGSYHQVAVEPISLTGPNYHAPGLEQTYPAERTGPVNFFWKRQWATSAMSGFLVQEVETRMETHNCRDNSLVPPSGEPHYWEYWEITGPNQFLPNPVDLWTIECSRLGTRGNWTKTGRVFWVPARPRPPTSRVGGAHNLPSTTTRPSNLGNPIHEATRGGVWDGCNTTTVLLNVHNPT
jgi:hypothetical protein